MSNERSPREVCSITIGINGLMAGLLAAGGPQLRVGRRLLLVGRPELVARLGDLGRDRLDVRDEAVERGAQPEILADRLLLAVRPDVLDDPFDVLLAGGLGLLADVRLDFVVRHLDPGALGERLERELARDRDRRLEHHLALEVLRAAAARGEVGLE